MKLKTKSILVKVYKEGLLNEEGKDLLLDILLKEEYKRKEEAKQRGFISLQKTLKAKKLKRIAKKL